LNLYIFTLMMNGVINNIQMDIPWCILFADDMVLIDESKIRIDQKIELWKKI
jgi:hypothetical protein